MTIKIGNEGIKKYPEHFLHGSFCSCPECRQKYLPPKLSSSDQKSKLSK